MGVPIQTDTMTREFSEVPAIGRSRPQEELFQQLQLLVPPTVAIVSVLLLLAVTLGFTQRVKSRVGSGDFPSLEFPLLPNPPTPLPLSCYNQCSFL